MIAFAWLNRTPNTGDIWCSPYHYFDFPDARAFHLTTDPIPPCDAVIFGGGAIEPYLRTDRLHDRVRARKKIAWGIGTSRSGKKENKDLVDDLDLCGVREYNRQGGVYVPCASCMSPLFDLHYEIEHEFVLYRHGSPNKMPPGPPIDGLPELNNRAPLSDALRFLASGEVVITNSFHGVYWATLLGRKVVCLPFSSKFYGYKFAPTYSTPDQWRLDAAQARTFPEALEDCRTVNLAFYHRVLELIASP